MQVININNVDYNVDKKALTSNSGYFASLFETEDLSNITLDIDVEILKFMIAIMSDEQVTMDMAQVDKYAYWMSYFMVDDRLLPKIDIDTIECKPEIIQSIYLLNKSSFNNIFGKLDLNAIFEKCKLNNDYIRLMDEIKLNMDDYFELFGLWKRWIIPETKMNDMLLFNLYDYKEYLKYTPKKVKLVNKTTFEPGQSVIYSKFNERFDKLTCGILDEFDYTNAIVAGGAIHECVINKDMTNIHTDIDIFVYTKEDFERTLKWFDNKFHGKILYAVLGCAVTICIVGIKRNFQVIYSSCGSKYDIIGYFDFGYCQMLYDGKNVLCTDDCLTSLRTQTTSLRSSYVKSGVPNFRYYKAFSKGYGIDTDKKLTDIMDDSANFTKRNKYYYPNDTDERERFFVKSCLGSKFVYKDVSKVIQNYNAVGINNFTNYRSMKIIDWDALYDSIAINKEGVFLNQEGKPIMVQMYAPYICFIEGHEKSRAVGRDYVPDYLVMHITDTQIIDFFNKLDAKILKSHTALDCYSAVDSCENIFGNPTTKRIKVSMSKPYDKYMLDKSATFVKDKIYSGYVSFNISKIWVTGRSAYIIKTLQRVDIKCERKILDNIGIVGGSQNYLKLIKKR